MTRPRRTLPRSAAATLRAWQATIASHPLLTAAEECDLATRAQAGDDAALERMICANLRLVLYRVPHYLPRGPRHDYGLSAEDLIQEGMLGLRKAALKFDPAFGCRFSTYAVPRIHQSITQAISDADAIRITADGRRQATKTGEPAPAIVESTDAPDGRPLPRHDPPSPLPSPEDHAAASEQRAVIADALATLPPRMRRIIRLRFGFGPNGEPQTLEAIGQRIGLTRERIRQLEREALVRLRGLLPPGTI